MTCTLLLVYAGAVAMLSSAEAGSPVYVDDDAALGGDGSSWNTAYRFLQDALADAASRGAGTEVRIAQGLYTPDQDEAGNATAGDRAAAFQLVNDVSILGGFAGLGEADPDQRDVDLYVTTLSGDLLGDDDMADFPGGPSYVDNSYHVLTGDAVDASAVLDGVTISAGFASEAGFPGMGGGLLTFGFANPIIADCTFEHNVAAQAGGAVSIFAAEPTIIDCAFVQNACVTPGKGGAIANSFSTASIVDCTFSLNVGFWGGAIHNSAGTPSFDGCVWFDNQADLGAAAFNENSAEPLFVDCVFEQNTALTGGGIFSTLSFPMIVTSNFTNNSSGLNGGAMHNAGGAATVIDSTFAGNTTNGVGGAVSNALSSSVFTGCLFTSNHGQDGGGAIQNSTSSDSLIVACRFVNNSSEIGGAIHNFNFSSPIVANCLMYGNTADVYGGGFSGGNGTPLVVNCTVAHNVAQEEAGGLFVVGPTTVANCIVVSNEPDQIVGGDLVTYSCVEGGWSGDGNIDEDPLFVDPDNGDYRLSPGSPCIDAGDNTAVPEDIETDLDGNPRFLEVPETPDTGNGTLPIVDMGAYESLGGGCLAVTSQEIVCHADGTTSTVNVEGLNACTGGTTQLTFTGSGGAIGDELCFTAVVNDGGFCCTTEICVTIPDCAPPGLQSDLNGDGVVGMADFLALLGAWGPCSDCGDCPGDFEGDCSVGLLDLLILLANWGS